MPNYLLCNSNVLIQEVVAGSLKGMHKFRDLHVPDATAEQRVPGLISTIPCKYLV